MFTAGDLLGHAYNSRLLLEQTWGQIGESLALAMSQADVAKTLDTVPYHGERLASGYGARRIYEALQSPALPKGRQARIRFLADSLAAQSDVSASYSRRLCREERRRRGGDPWISNRWR